MHPIIVVKLGGSTLGAHDTALRDIAAAQSDGARIVVVHGGGALISEWLAAAGIDARFVHGLRVTDARSLDIVVGVLAGVVNKRIVAELSALGARAAGISGADASILRARRYDAELEYVGRIERVDPALLHDLLGGGYVPVVAPIAFEVEKGRASQMLNVNADTAAGEIAAALGAASLVFLTDVAGVLAEDKSLLAHLTPDDARSLIALGVVAGGMIPKVEAAIRACGAGCSTRIIDGTIAGALANVLVGGAGGTTVTS